MQIPVRQANRLGGLTSCSSGWRPAIKCIVGSELSRLPIRVSPLVCKGASLAGEVCRFFAKVRRLLAKCVACLQGCVASLQTYIPLAMNWKRTRSMFLERTRFRFILEKNPLKSGNITNCKHICVNLCKECILCARGNGVGYVC